MASYYDTNKATVANSKGFATGELQPGTLLERRVFKKVAGAKVMLH